MHWPLVTITLISGQFINKWYLTQCYCLLFKQVVIMIVINRDVDNRLRI